MVVNEDPMLCGTIAGLLPIIGTIYALDNAVNGDEPVYWTFVDSDYVDEFLASY